MLSVFFNAILYVCMGIPLMVIMVEAIRVKQDRNFAAFSVEYIVLFVSQIIYTLLGSDFYYGYVLISSVIVILSTITLVDFRLADRKKRQTEFLLYLFSFAILSGTTLFYFYRFFIIADQKVLLLSSINMFATAIISTVVLSKRFEEESYIFIAGIFLWVLHSFGFTDSNTVVNRFFTALFYGNISWYVARRFIKRFKSLENDIRLLSRTRDVVSEMLHELSTSVKDLSAVDDMMHTVLKSTQKALDVDGVAVYQIAKDDKDEDILVFTRSTGSFWPTSPENDIVFIKKKYADYTLENTKFKIGEGIIGQVAQKGKPIQLDLELDRQQMTELGLNSKLIKNILAVPLQIKDNVLGVMVIENKINDTMFDVHDVHLLQSLADQAAVSINNVRIYAELAETEKVKQEMHVASRIQQQLVPNSIPDVLNMGISPFIKPAREVGGDYYDFLPYDEEHLGIVIGDVSGKGLPAGMVMIMAHTALHIVARNIGQTRDILIAFSKEMYSRIQLGHFMTMNILLWHGSQRKLYYSGAGHEHIIWYHKNTDSVERIKAGGLAVGLLEDVAEHIKQCELQTEQGDVLVLYTDGITEARKADNEMFSIDRLQNSVKRHAPLQNQQKIKNAIMNDVFTFTNNYEQYDDITLLVLHVK